MRGQGLTMETEIYLSPYLAPPCHTSGTLVATKSSAPRTRRSQDG